MLEGTLNVTVGDDVRFEFEVANASDEPVEVTFRDAGKVDFAVVEDGEEIWRWSDGRVFAQALETAQFHPGERATFEEEWPSPQPGNFVAVAELHARETDVRARTPFSV